MRVPQRGATQLTVTLEEAKALHPYPRSILTLDAGTAAVVKWEPYASYNLGRCVPGCGQCIPVRRAAWSARWSLPWLLLVVWSLSGLV